MPQADSLPDEIKSLAVRNGIEIKHSTFRADADRLVRGLKPRFRNTHGLSTFEVVLFSLGAWAFSTAVAVVSLFASFVAAAQFGSSSPLFPLNYLALLPLFSVIVIAIAGPPTVAIRLRRAGRLSWPKAWAAIGFSPALTGVALSVASSLR
jgi:hypothetical protein